MLVGKDKNKQISYSIQLNNIFRAFVAVGILSMKKTYTMRGCGACGAELHGISEKQVSLPLFLQVFTNIYLYTIDPACQMVGYEFPNEYLLDRSLYQVSLSCSQLPYYARGLLPLLCCSLPSKVSALTDLGMVRGLE